MSNAIEVKLGLDPGVFDTDGNGLGDGAVDSDGDGLPNAVEVEIGLDPGVGETTPGVADGAGDADGDGVPDGADCFPLDPTRSACLPSNPNDHTPPIITLIEPTTARRIQ